MEEIIKPLIGKFLYNDIVNTYNKINKERYTVVRTYNYSLYQFEGSVNELIEKLSIFPKDAQIWFNHNFDTNSDNHITVRFKDLETDDEYNDRICRTITEILSK